MESPLGQPSRILLLAGAVTAGAIGLAGLAYAGDSGLKTLSLQLPGGQVARIEYSGPVQPQLVVVPLTPSGRAMPVALPMIAGGANPAVPSAPYNPFAAPDSFAQLDRISAMLNQQAAAMMQAVQIMALPPLAGGAMVPAAMTGAPSGPGGISYSFVAFSSGTGGTCMQSIQMTSGGQGQAPHIVQQSAGSCGGAKAGVPAVNPVSPSNRVPALLRVRDVHPMSVPQASQT
jgi:hypothetical protein